MDIRRQLVITIFGSSKPRTGSPEYDQAFQLGRALVVKGFSVCNGGFAGTMEAAAHGAREAGGEAIGVTCDLIPRPANQWISREIRTPRLVDRISTLAELAAGYVILPGGTGTLLELAYVLEMVNKGFSEERPIVLLGTFWEPILEPLKEEMMQEGLANLARFLTVAHSPEEAASILAERLRR
jgi:uncharacterized protein (TIGR00730 family)